MERSFPHSVVGPVVPYRVSLEAATRKVGGFDSADLPDAIVQQRLGEDYSMSYERLMSEGI